MKTQYNFIIDFSFDGEKLTIFELGDFFTSSLNRLDKLRQMENKVPLHKEYMAQLKSIYPNAIYLNTRGRSISFHDLSTDHEEHYSFRSKQAIEKLLIYRGKLGQTQEFKRPIIASLEGLPSIDDRAFLATLTNESFQLLNYPKGVLREAARDKIVFHAFTTDSPLCPKTLLLDLRDDDFSLHLDTFFKQHQASHYVIKPTDLTLSLGVSIVTQDEARLLIQKLHLRIRIDSSVDVGDWAASFCQGNYFVLVQTCVPSKILIFKNKPYRPTGRAIMRAIFNEENSYPVLSCLGQYWELPERSVSESFSSSSLVSPGDDDNCIILPIDDIDWHKINQEINRHLPSVLLRMHITSLDQLAQKFQFSSAMQAYATYLNLAKLTPHSLESIPLQSDLEREIVFIFEQLDYRSFNIKQKPGFFQQTMISNAPYIEKNEAMKKPLLETVVKRSLPINVIKNRQHEESFLLLSRHNTQLLGWFLFYTVILVLISSVIKEFAMNNPPSP